MSHDRLPDTFMGMTPTQRLRMRRQAEDAGWLLPDTSEVLHRFDDGWSLRSPVRAGDYGRESYLMCNCCGEYVHLDLDPTEIFSMADRQDLDPKLRGARLVSLRDADNMPHASMWMMDGHAYFALGVSNGKVKPAHEKRIVEWTCANGYHWWGKHTGGRSVNLAELMGRVEPVAEDHETAELAAQVYLDMLPEPDPDAPEYLKVPSHATRTIISPQMKMKMQRQLGQFVSHSIILARQHSSHADELLELEQRSSALHATVLQLGDAQLAAEDVDLMWELIDEVGDRLVAIDDELFERALSQVQVA